MFDLKERAQDFRTLHVPGRLVVLFNIWDPGSAKAITAAGARAIATGSWSVAAANGSGDGGRIPIDLVVDNLTRIVRATDLSVTVDIESGYGTLVKRSGERLRARSRPG
jgi:2-methylisocitrate lyase-like PEP mutase family enzyme